MSASSITLSPDLSKRLLEKATSRGLTVEQYVTMLIGELPPLQRSEESEAMKAAWDRILNRTPEEIAADRERILAVSERGRELTPGKTLDDVVKGTWPGDETEEEILAALEELS